MEQRRYIITLINGDYVNLVDVDSGEPIVIAMALLPEEIEEGGMVIYENFTYIYAG